MVALFRNLTQHERAVHRPVADEEDAAARRRRLLFELVLFRPPAQGRDPPAPRVVIESQSLTVGRESAIERGGSRRGGEQRQAGAVRSDRPQVVAPLAVGVEDQPAPVGRPLDAALAVLIVGQLAQTGAVGANPEEIFAGTGERQGEARPVRRDRGIKDWPRGRVDHGGIADQGPALGIEGGAAEREGGVRAPARAIRPSRARLKPATVGCGGRERLGRPEGLAARLVHRQAPEAHGAAAVADEIEEVPVRRPDGRPVDVGVVEERHRLLLRLRAVRRHGPEIALRGLAFESPEGDALAVGRPGRLHRVVAGEQALLPRIEPHRPELPEVAPAERERALLRGHEDLPCRRGTTTAGSRSRRRAWATRRSRP